MYSGMWRCEKFFGPSQSVTPDSVLAHLQNDSPSLSHHGSSPASLDRVEFLSQLCIGDDNDEEPYAIGDDYMQDFHDPADVQPPLSPRLLHVGKPWEVSTPIPEDNVPIYVDESPLLATEIPDMDEHAMIICGLHEAQHLDYAPLDMIPQKKSAIASSCPELPTMLRQHVKNYRDRALQDELTLCGCAGMIQEDEEGSCNPEDHYLECKMRTDYAMWVIWMHKRSSQNEGLDLVQRLLSCAEAVACRDTRQAHALLQAVHELASPYGDSLQRVAFCFMEGLAARLCQHNVTGSTPANQAVPTLENGGINKFASQSRRYAHGKVSEEVLRRQQEAFHFMCEVCPYIPFGHFIANSTIMEAVEGEEMVHVIDLGMTGGPQWLALICGLATRPGGAPKLLRITGFGTFGSQLEEIGKVLHQEAAKVQLGVWGKTHNLSQLLELSERSSLSVV